MRSALNTSLGTNTSKWIAAVLLGGRVLGVPYDATTVLAVDWRSEAVSTFGQVGTTRKKWAAGVAVTFLPDVDVLPLLYTAVFLRFFRMILLEVCDGVCVD